MTRVRPYRRNGRRVSGYSRLSPKRARRNARRSWRAFRLKRRGVAVGFGSIAIAELSAWAGMRTLALALTAIGIVLVGAGLAARRAAH